MALVIIGFCVVGVSVPFTFAVFSIIVIESATTFTWNDSSTGFPAFMSVFQVIFPLLSVPFAVIEPSTSSVPSGTVSIVRMLVASRLPLFVTFITYVITSPF